MDSNENGVSVLSAEAKSPETPSRRVKRKETQNERLLWFLRSHRGLTQLEAFNLLGICRLSERIRELEYDGLIIEHRRETTANGAHVIRYILHGRDQS